MKDRTLILGAGRACINEFLCIGGGASNTSRKSRTVSFFETYVVRCLRYSFISNSPTIFNVFVRRQSAGNLYKMLRRRIVFFWQSCSLTVLMYRIVFFWQGILQLCQSFCCPAVKCKARDVKDPADRGCGNFICILKEQKLLVVLGKHGQSIFQADDFQQLFLRIIFCRIRLSKRFWL